MNPGNDPDPATLAERIDALKDPGQCGEDFDARSWLWMLLLGAAVPAVLLLIGWRL